MVNVCSECVVNASHGAPRSRRQHTAPAAPVHNAQHNIHIININIATIQTSPIPLKECVYVCVRVCVRVCVQMPHNGVHPQVTVRRGGGCSPSHRRGWFRCPVSSRSVKTQILYALTVFCTAGS